MRWFRALMPREERFFELFTRHSDVVVAGGSDSRLDPLLLMAYTALGTLSRRTDMPPEEVSRPFDRMRDGFVLGEGAGMLILEDLDRARKRGAKVYAEVLGFGSSFDAYSIIKPDPDGKGAARAIRNALDEARVDPSEIEYLALAEALFLEKYAEARR